MNEIQTALLGRHKLESRLSSAVETTYRDRSRGTVVDVGGGTARSRDFWPSTWTYISIDPDVRMVSLEDRAAPVERLVGDASSIPLADGSADVVLMQCVSHHLDADTWPRSLIEASRLLKDDGYFVFLDGVWSKRRWISRLFWRLDAGRHPRLSSDLEHAIAQRFDVVETQRFALVHDSILLTARASS